MSAKYIDTKINNFAHVGMQNIQGEDFHKQSFMVSCKHFKDNRKNCYRDI